MSDDPLDDLPDATFVSVATAAQEVRVCARLRVKREIEMAQALGLFRLSASTGALENLQRAEKAFSDAIAADLRAMWALYGAAAHGVDN